MADLESLDIQWQRQRLVFATAYLATEADTEAKREWIAGILADASVQLARLGIGTFHLPKP